MAKEKEIKVSFKLDRSTKGAHRFQEVDSKGEDLDIASGAAVGNMYIRKDKIGEKAPEKLEVTIRYA